MSIKSMHYQKRQRIAMAMHCALLAMTMAWTTLRNNGAFQVPLQSIIWLWHVSFTHGPDEVVHTLEQLMLRICSGLLIQKTRWNDDDKRKRQKTWSMRDSKQELPKVQLLDRLRKLILPARGAKIHPPPPSLPRHTHTHTYQKKWEMPTSSENRWIN